MNTRLFAGKVPRGLEWLVQRFVPDVQDAINRASRMQSYTAGALPDAAEGVRTWIFVSDESGGAVPAFSDGTNWRRCTDRAIVS